MQTQRVTAKDIDAGQIRVPRGTKALLPAERTQIEVSVLGKRMSARWDPRNGPDRPRSGIIRFGRGSLDHLVNEKQVFNVRRSSDGILELT